jgi:hypothetical protein
VNRYELMTRINALVKLQAALTDAADAALPEATAARMNELLDETWQELRNALNSYYPGQ